MDAARLNFSHGTHAEHAEALRLVREAAARHGRAVAVLQDLSGTKVRVGEIAGGSIELESGSAVVLTPRAGAEPPAEIPVAYPDLARCVKPGDPVLLADGDLELAVSEVRGADVICRVVVGGLLSSRKGISLPSGSIEAPSLTDKDRGDLAFGIRIGVDYVALSFVRSAANLVEARRFAEGLGSRVPWIAKIEKHEAVRAIDEIVAAADGIMVARGDLGVETPLEHVPVLQKLLIAAANRAAKPVITATQMLKSMVDNPRPTRAEVSDVANAILDGTDAVMLSEETAAGRFPVEAARMMARVAHDVETSLPREKGQMETEPATTLDVPEAVADSACRLASEIGASAVIALTESGATPRLVAKYRPRAVIVAPTAGEETYRRLALVRGVVPLRVPASVRTAADPIEAVVAEARGAGLVHPGERVVVTCGLPMGIPGSTNAIRALVVSAT
jgi:pyruvate kinase